MSVRLQYVGQSHFRTVSVADLKKAGFDKDASKIEVARIDTEPAENPKSLESFAEVSQEQADFLLKREPKEWKILADDEQPSGDAPDDGELRVAPDGSLPDETGDSTTSDAGAPDAGANAGSTAGSGTSAPRARASRT